jgi:hypothetical protein
VANWVSNLCIIKFPTGMKVSARMKTNRIVTMRLNSFVLLKLFAISAVRVAREISPPGELRVQKIFDR